MKVTFLSSPFAITFVLDFTLRIHYLHSSPVLPAQCFLPFHHGLGCSQKKWSKKEAFSHTVLSTSNSHTASPHKVVLHHSTTKCLNLVTTPLVLLHVAAVPHDLPWCNTTSQHYLFQNPERPKCNGINPECFAMGLLYTSLEIYTMVVQELPHLTVINYYMT